MEPWIPAQFLDVQVPAPGKSGKPLVVPLLARLALRTLFLSFPTFVPSL